MHMLSPERKRLQGNGPPFWLNHMSVIPQLSLRAYGTESEPLLEVSMFLPAGLGFSRKDITIAPEELPALWAEWLADPELCAEQRFGWTYCKPKPLNIDDLLEGI